ncbi:MAG: hypothetical protein Q9201_006434 [Fulgogasparrea decipioides]
MTAVAPKDQLLHGQKRRRGAIEEEHLPNATLHLPSKKTKSRRQLQHETNTTYWDSLSKIYLTRRALDELDRRNRRRAGLARTIVARGLGLVDEPGLLKNPSKGLSRFARYGGPDLRDLRGYPEPSTANSTAHVMPSDQTSSRTQSKSRNTLGDSTAKTTTLKTKKTSPYDPNFEQNLIDNKIYPDDYDFPDGRDPPRPANEDGILSRLCQPRPSLSPSQFSSKEFRTFKQKNSRALNEDAVMSDVFPIIQGTAPIPSAKNLALGNFEPLTHGNFVDAKPDSYDGAYPAQIDLRIREELGSYITPATQGHAPALPNFFTEVKGPDGSAAVAKRQACFDGAFGARGVHKLRSYEAEDPHTIYDGNAYTITSTYHNGHLQLYALHPSEPMDSENPPEYHMTQLNTFAITGTAERYREGVGAYRNARDWAKEQRDGLIAAANGRAMGMSKETSTIDPSIHSMSQSTTGLDAAASETSADELSQAANQSFGLPRKRLKREPEKRSSNPNLRSRYKKGSLEAGLAAKIVSPRGNNVS